MGRRKRSIEPIVVTVVSDELFDDARNEEYLKVAQTLVSQPKPTAVVQRLTRDLYFRRWAAPRYEICLYIVWAA